MSGSVSTVSARAHCVVEKEALIACRDVIEGLASREACLATCRDNILTYSTCSLSVEWLY